mmetsp:Transcript_9209/g.25837  ORF Transcript_9209/g.25837 Transcript_9209/m.25837 type:complete len:232 (-) Transcript_9209:390-1085(-)
MAKACWTSGRNICCWYAACSCWYLIASASWAMNHELTFASCLSKRLSSSLVGSRPSNGPSPMVYCCTSLLAARSLRSPAPLTQLLSTKEEMSASGVDHVGEDSASLARRILPTTTASGSWPTMGPASSTHCLVASGSARSAFSPRAPSWFSAAKTAISSESAVIASTAAEVRCCTRRKRLAERTCRSVVWGVPRMASPPTTLRLGHGSAAAARTRWQLSMMLFADFGPWIW